MGKPNWYFLLESQYHKWLVGKGMVTLATVPEERGGKDWSGRLRWLGLRGHGGNHKGWEKRMELRDESEVSQEGLRHPLGPESINFNTKK